MPGCLIITAVESGLWSVREEGGETLLDLYTKPAAVRFAEAWAQTHGASEIRIYDEDGALERILKQPVKSPEVKS
jgi:hypothetical protein